MEPGCFGRDQPARHGLGDEVGRAHVEAHDGVEVLDGDVEQQLGPVGAGVVDEDVERLGARDRGLHGGEVGDVEDERLGLLPARTDRRRRRLDLARRARHQRHMRSGVRQRRGRRQADAPPGARHQRTLAVEAEGGGRRGGPIVVTSMEKRSLSPSPRTSRGERRGEGGAEVRRRRLWPPLTLTLSPRRKRRGERGLYHSAAAAYGTLRPP